MISNLFYAFGKQEEVQSRVKGQIPKKWLQSANSWAFDVWKSWAQKYIFVSRNRNAIPLKHLWKYVDRINRLSTHFAI